MNQSYAQIFATIDIINIPVHAGPIVGAFWVLSFACVIPIFVMACMYEYAKFIKNDPKDSPDFYGAAVRMFVFFIAFLVYGAVMKIAYFFDFISMTLISWSEWSDFVTSLSNQLSQSNGTPLLNFHFSSVLMYVTLFLATGAETALMVLRFGALYVAFCVGPFIILLSVYRPLRHIFNGWLTYFTQISFWPITMKLVQSAVLAFQFKSFIVGGNVFIITLTSFVMVLMFLGVIPLTAIFLSQKNMGAAAEGGFGAMKSIAVGGVGAVTSAVGGFVSGAAIEAGLEKTAGAAAAAGPDSAAPAQPTISAGDNPSNAVKDDKTDKADSTGSGEQK